jgi:hypothetical protein
VKKNGERGDGVKEELPKGVAAEPIEHGVYVAVSYRYFL